jgi:hypothetical protein
VKHIAVKVLLNVGAEISKSDTAWLDPRQNINKGDDDPREGSP